MFSYFKTCTIIEGCINSLSLYRNGGKIYCDVSKHDVSKLVSELIEYSIPFSLSTKTITYNDDVIVEGYRFIISYNKKAG